MALSTHLLLRIKPPPVPSLLKSHRSSSSSILSRKFLIPSPCHRKPIKEIMMKPQAASVQSAVSEAMRLIQASPPTWQSAILSNLLIFLLGSPILVSGLSVSGIAAAFLLGTLTWRAFGSSGFLLVATYFVLGTAVTKVRMTQKEAEGVAEKRKGRRGPGSVIGSSAAGCICAFLAIFRAGGIGYSRLWQLGFVASFCTKLSDTASSEIGKAYGKTTYFAVIGGEETESDDRTVSDGADDESTESEYVVDGVVEKGRRVVPGAGLWVRLEDSAFKDYREMQRNYATLEALDDRILACGSSNQVGPSGFVGVVTASGSTALDVQIGVLLPKKNKISLHELEELGVEYGVQDLVGLRLPTADDIVRYLVTTLKVVPRGTEGAVSVEGTFAGLLAAILLAFVGCLMREITAPEAIICVIASQIANFGESIIGAALQDKEGFRWLNNDAVNVINISMGSILAVFMQQVLLQNVRM